MAVNILLTHLILSRRLADDHRAHQQCPVEHKEICKNHPSRSGLRDYMKTKLDFPHGTAHLTSLFDCTIEMRVHVLDTSAESSKAGGSCQNTPMWKLGGQLRDCTKWEEIRQFSLMSAENTVARNAYYQVTPKAQEICSPGGATALSEQLDQVTPAGTTPLDKALQLLKVEYATRYNNIGFSIIILSVASKPDDHEKFVSALQELGVRAYFNMVVRLTGEKDAAKEKEISDYYQDIERLVSFPFVVVSGIKTEAQQVKDAGNDFFVYSVFLHHLRQQGSKMEFLYNIDKKRMRKAEAMMLVEHLLTFEDREGASEFVEMPAQFCDNVNTKLSEKNPLGEVEDPLDNQMKPVIDLEKLKEFLDVDHKLMQMQGAAGADKQGEGANAGSKSLMLLRADPTVTQATYPPDAQYIGKEGNGVIAGGAPQSMLPSAEPMLKQAAYPEDAQYVGKEGNGVKAGSDQQSILPSADAMAKQATYPPDAQYNGKEGNGVNAGKDQQSFLLSAEATAKRATYPPDGSARGDQRSGPLSTEAMANLAKDFQR